MTDDYLLFVGEEVSDWREQLPQMTIRAIATFNDGKTQEETITLDLTRAENMAKIDDLIGFQPEIIERRYVEVEKIDEPLHSIPLKQCEVVPGSVQTLVYGDTFEYNVGNEDASDTAYFLISEESIDTAAKQGMLDKDGILRVDSSSNLYGRWYGYDGGDGYIAVLERNNDGTFTGMVYKVSEQLILACMK